MPDLRLSTSVDDLLLASLADGNDPAKTGRYLVTFNPGAAEAGTQSLRSAFGMRIASARDFTAQAVTFEQTGDADAIVFPEIGVALVGGEAAAQRDFNTPAGLQALTTGNQAIASTDPEYFMFAAQAKAATGIAEQQENDTDAVGPLVLGTTWGLTACKVPASHYDGTGIKLAVLDTGFDLGHPEFVGRSFTTNTFVGQPVQDLHGHGTHTTGTACGPRTPAGPIPAYGIGYRVPIYSGKVLTNTGTGTQAQVLAGMNWAIANQCVVISMSLGAQIPVQPSYTAAGAAALSAGCLIIAAAGNASHRPTLIAATGAPANSPTIMSVAALDNALNLAFFSNGGKVDIAGPGVNVFSSWPRPTLHNTISGTSMATPHVAGCAALWAQSSAALRGTALRARLQAAAKHLPFPATDVGAGLVQAP